MASGKELMELKKNLEAKEREILEKEKLEETYARTRMISRLSE